MALTKEFAVIQGPPGTGKTYIGLKVDDKCHLDKCFHFFLFFFLPEPVFIAFVSNRVLV